MNQNLALRPIIEPMRDARRSFTRMRICDAAREIFAVHGFAGSKIEQIAQAAGTQRSTLYNHFRDKNEILAAIAEEYLAGLADLIKRLPGPMPTRAEIEVWLGEVVAFSARERAPTVLFVSLGSSIDVPDALTVLGGRLIPLLAEQLPAFARALEPGADRQLARALSLQHQLGWLCMHHAQQRHSEIAAAMLSVTAEYFENFVHHTPE